MSQALSQGRLVSAFRSFERAAVQLEQRHSTLQSKVEILERQLLGANRRLEALLDALPGGVAVLAPDGRVLRTNHAFESFGLADGEGLSALTPLLDGAHSGGTTRLSCGGRDLVVTLLRVEDDERSRVVTVQDVTEIRREEEEGGRRRRLEALGRMAAELAHEVRNPLGSIRLFAGMLHEDLTDDPEARGMTGQILAATSGLEGTVSNLLSFAAPGAGRRREVELGRLAIEACDLLSAACAVRGVTLVGPVGGSSWIVDADPEGIRQVLLNLLGNALAATGDAGRISVEIEGDDRVVTLSVCDDGRGISAEDLPRVFDPFFSRSDGGTGLGLSIVHGIVERHEGRITLDSAVGAGTRVRVELPIRAGIREEPILG